jgi:hypothetical protein
VRVYSIASILLLTCTPGLAQTGSISGVVLRPDGTGISGATLFYGRLAPAKPKAAAAMLAPISTATTGTNGSFALQNLSAGTYLVCAEVPGYLDPCHWSSSPPTFLVTAGQLVSGAAIHLNPAHQLQVQINDPQGLLANDGKTAGAFLHIGVQGVSGVFQRAVLADSNATSRHYVVTVPYDSPVNMLVSGSAFQVNDNAGMAIANTGKLTQVTVPSVGAAPTLVFSVAGIHAP